MKKIKTNLSLLLFILLPAMVFSQALTATISKEEQELYRRIMEYRAKKNLPDIPFSKSLTIVAKTHAWDLEVNQPAKGKCNLHSWSDKGKWKSCCYTKDHAKARCMWDKPKELTTYKGTGYEISFWSSGRATAAGALASWKSSAGHNNVIINSGIWEKSTWKAIGIGIYGSYAVVWFGKVSDTEEEPEKEE